MTSMAKNQNTANQKSDILKKENLSRKAKVFARLKDSFCKAVFAEDYECLHCGAEMLENSHFYLCEKCFNSIDFIQNACDICGDKVSRFDIICNRCKEVAHSFTKAFCVAKYVGTARNLVQKLKYGDGKYLSEALGQMMAEKLKESLNQPLPNTTEKASEKAPENTSENTPETVSENTPFYSFQNSAKKFDLTNEQTPKAALMLTNIDFVVPVPLNKKRVKKRGYNQSFLLAKAVANECHLPLLPHLIKRVKNTPTQTSLPVKQRRENVKNAFEIVDAAAVKDATILLIDDIVTTGATTDEIAKLLLKHRAKAVFVLAFCHA